MINSLELYKEALDECQSKYGNDAPKFYEKMQSLYSACDQEESESVEDQKTDSDPEQ